ncbi:hypothetical protein REPUB_Repub07fG0103600 [Reevesia pubescens]
MSQCKKLCPVSVWFPPDLGFVKFNVDGSSKGNPSPAGCRGVLQDSSGHIVAMFFGPLGVQESNVAELVVIKTALEDFVQTRWISCCNLIVESDSVIAVKWCLNEEARPWRLWDIFSDIDTLLLEI